MKLEKTYREAFTPLNSAAKKSGLLLKNSAIIMESTFGRLSLGTAFHENVFDFAYIRYILFLRIQKMDENYLTWLNNVIKFLRENTD